MRSRTLGEPTRAVTLQGKTVVRESKLFIQEYGSFVPTAPYDNHFIYANSTPEMPSYMCTCGSPAIVINHTDPLSRMLVCMFHATYGKHTQSS